MSVIFVSITINNHIIAIAEKISSIQDEITGNLLNINHRKKTDCLKFPRRKSCQNQLLERAEYSQI